VQRKFWGLTWARGYDIETCRPSAARRLLGYGGVAQALMGMFLAKPVTMATLWGLPEIVIASIAGAWLYQE
jgi:hypothetical protein